MAELLLELLDGRRGIAVCQHVVGNDGQLQQSLHANGDVEEGRIKVTLLVLKEVGFEQEVEA
ncbi:hypothetical protein D9M72_523860 [compost metagenome]